MKVVQDFLWLIVRYYFTIFCRGKHYFKAKYTSNSLESEISFYITFQIYEKNIYNKL